MKTTMRNRFGKMTAKAAAILPAFLIAFSAIAANPPDAFNDGIDRTDPNFVKASLLVMSPGNELYSCVGHSVLRLECPKFGLDYCFTYESESARNRILSFLAGNLKMGMFAIPVSKHLKMCADEGRGVMQYTLNLPPDAKQRLWKYLDCKVAEGVNLPYDYLLRGCAYAAFSAICESLKPNYTLQIDKWPERFDVWTRREFVDAKVDAQVYPWNRFFIHTMAGSEGDNDVPKAMKVVLSADLLELLRMARVNGKPLVDDQGKELLAPTLCVSRPVITPMAIAVGLLSVSIVNLFFCNVCGKWVAVAFLVLQSLFGAFFTYLIFFSSLPATSWNWQIVPFNLLPLVFWKWRKKWALWFAGVLMLWEIGMIAYPHRLTDPAYLVLVAAYVLMYVRLGWKWNCAATERCTVEQLTGRACRPATTV